MIDGLLTVLLFLTSVFLILLVLVQRGRGGGLAGAFGGMGGQSAFGTKAGDLFTRITMVVATVWPRSSRLFVTYVRETATLPIQEPSPARRPALRPRRLPGRAAPERDARFHD